jgi:putative redox protein
MTMEERTATATIGQDLYRTEMKIGNHLLIADEPASVGGKDLGPRPGDYILMSLASCTAITLRMYANRKNFDVQQIRVGVSGGDTTDKTVLKTNIEIIGSLTDDQRARMMQIAKLCPTHKMLTRPIEIETLLSIEKS